MNSNTSKASDGAYDEAPASIPQTTPRSIGYGHPEFQFVQSIMEMQKSLGEINASIQALNKTVDSTKSKVDDLVNWKNMIFGGAITIGFLIGLAVAMFKIFEHVPVIPPSSTQVIQAPSVSSPTHKH
ncbi:hypothetical protein [Methylobacter tundripaludum]|uniref:hypothetical protein n=1 Tax=Methylobacter tundripaludum TaxID=173365 RepID=UPI000CEADB84|nr:hypothetical protein [Methylobacter tundripaludum]